MKQKEFITIEQAKENAYKKGLWCDSYKPKRNKIKCSLVVGFVVLCLVTPCTNWLIIPLGKVISKYPLWVYK